MASIYQTKRQISDIHLSEFFIEELTLSCVESILRKFEKSLKKVTFHRCFIGYKDFHALLSLVEDVEEFEFTDSRIKLMPPVIAENKEDSPFLFNVEKLKKLDLSGSSFYFAREDKESSFMYNFARMLGKSSALESLSADSSLLKYFPFDEKKLKSLRLERVGPKFMRIGDVLESQYNLTTLDLMTCFIMDDVVKVIQTSLGGLKVLKINISCLTPKGFSLLTELHLKELHFKAMKAKWIVSSMSSKLFKTLECLYANLDELLISPQIFCNMFKSLKGLETIHIKTNTVEIMDVIFQSDLRTTLKSCTIEFSNLHSILTLKKLSPKIGGLEVVGIVEQAADKLIELKILNLDESMAKTANFSKLENFCNLKKLTINGFTISEKLLIWGLVNFPKLEHLELKDVNNGGNTLVFNDAFLDIIDKMQAAGGNLKVLDIECKKIALTNNVMSSHFPIIEYKRQNQIVLRHR